MIVVTRMGCCSPTEHYRGGFALARHMSRMVCAVRGSTTSTVGRNCMQIQIVGRQHKK